MTVDVEQIVRNNINRTYHLSLATVSNNMPWVCEVHFVYDDQLNLYFRSKPSRRHSQEIAGNPQVAGNIIDKHDIGELPLGIYFEGTAELLEAGDEQDAIAQIIMSKLKAPDTILEEAKDPEGHQFYKITVNKWHAFGKFGDHPVQRQTLDWNS